MSNNYFKKAMVLSCLFSSAVFADIHDRIEYKLNRVLKDVDVLVNGNTGNCMPVTQHDIDLGSGTFIINESGDWCLESDVQGTIVIDADCVCFDLNCHTIDANGAANAIAAGAHNSIAIFNGCVINSTEAGIDLVACEDVAVSSIDFRNNSDISLYIHSALVGPCPTFSVSNPSQGILVENCNVTQGNRAMLFRGCNELRVQNCDVYENTNTIANAVVSAEFCQDGVFENVWVNNNIKAVPGQGQGPVGPFGPETAVMLAWASKNIQFNGCQTNGNSCEFIPGMLVALLVNGLVFDADCGLLFNQTTGVIIDGHQSNNNTNANSNLVGIGLMFIPDGEVKNSQTHGNITTQANGNQGSFLTQDFLFGLGVLGCPGAHIINHQSNENKSRNSITGIGGEAYGIFVSSALGQVGDGAMIEDSQAHNNGDFNETSKAVGICVGYGPQIQISNGAIIRNCQSNGTQGHACVCAFGCYWNNVVYENCQADNNAAFGTSDPANNCLFGYGYGFAVCGNVRDVRFIGCTASNNTCINDKAAGIDAADYPPFIPGAEPAFLAFPPSLVVIEGCVTNGNVSTSNFGSGIRASGVTSCVVKDSEAFSNTSTGTGFGNGILFDTCSDSKIIRSQMHENLNAGVELVGTNTNIAIIESVAMKNNIGFDVPQNATLVCGLVQDCRAVDNTTVGFNHGPSPLQTTYIGNEAQCNGLDYAINGGIISLYQLHWLTGLMNNVSGQATISPWTNLSALP